MTIPPSRQLIDGMLVPASDGATYPIINPATGQEIGVAPDGTAADIEAAIAAARRAFDESDWSTNTELRVRCICQLQLALLDTADDFRALTTAEVGMPGFLPGWRRTSLCGSSSNASRRSRSISGKPSECTRQTSGATPRCPSRSPSIESGPGVRQ